MKDLDESLKHVPTNRKVWGKRIVKCKDRKSLEKLLHEKIPLSQIDVSGIEDFSSLFDGHDNWSGIEDWDVSKATTMRGMFEGCKDFDGDLSKWNVSNCRDMSYMFAGCKKFKGSGLEKWNVSNVQDMERMFWQCRSLRVVKVSRWPISCKSLSMFRGCAADPRKETLRRLAKNLAQAHDDYNTIRKQIDHCVDLKFNDPRVFIDIEWMIREL